MPGLKSYIRGLVCLCFLLLAASAAAVSAYADEPDPVAADLADGLYNIVNKQTGLYLDVMDIKFDTKGSAYLDKQTKLDGQDHKILRQEDGTYRIVPQSDGGQYTLRVSVPAAGGRVQKSKSVDDNSAFYIIPREDGYFSIHPTGGEGVGLALTVGGRYQNELSLATDAGSDLQFWSIVPVTPRAVSISAPASQIKVYDIDKIAVIISPAYLEAAVTYSSSDESVLLIDENGTFCAIAPGTVYLTAQAGEQTATCKVTVSDVTAFTWYSQHNVSEGGWNAMALSNLYFSAGVTKRFISDRYNGNADWMDEGCYVTSLAIVLNNLGAKMTQGYDFRTGQNGNLPADPYTVALANSGNMGSVTGKEVLRGNPIYVVDYLVLSRFKVDGKTLTEHKTYNVTKQAIKNALDAHPEGVIVRMNKGNDSHFIVFTKCLNPEEKNPNKYEFLVCDPAAYKPSEGAHVRFEDSISYRTMYYRYGNMTMLQTISVVK